MSRTIRFLLSLWEGDLGKAIKKIQCGLENSLLELNFFLQFIQWSLCFRLKRQKYSRQRKSFSLKYLRMVTFCLVDSLCHENLIVNPMSYFSEFASGYVLLNTKDGSTMVCLSHFNLEFFVLVRHLRKLKRIVFSHIFRLPTYGQTKSFTARRSNFLPTRGCITKLHRSISVDGSP